VVDGFQRMPRRISFTHNWRNPCYTVKVGNTSDPIYRPHLIRLGLGEQFRFPLPSGDEVVATIDKPPSVAIYLNDDAVAKITPILVTSGVKVGFSVHFRQVATVSICEESLPLICSVYWGIASNHFRILNRCGSRMCFWKKTGGWGTGNATLVVSRRVHSSFLPIAISATLVSLLDTPSGD